jgi:glycosyltransferase involved in cell wall biosynthesis
MFSSIIAGLRVREVDLVWGTSPPIFQALTAWFLARCKRVPLLFEVRDLWPYFAVDVGVLRQPLLIRLSNWLERFLYRRAARVVVNSPGYIEHVRSHGAKAVDLVPNGVDVAMFDPKADGAIFRRTNNLEANYVVMYAGAHGMSNDLGVLLEAAARLRDVPELVIVLLGDGKEKPGLMARAHALGLSNVRFVPPVPKRLMPNALAAADACIAILKPIEAYKTTFPNKVFDYMAAGRPVVLAIDGVIRKVVEEAGAGIFVTPGDPVALEKVLRGLIADRELGVRMGLAGSVYVSEHYDRPKLAERMIWVMEQMLEGEAKGVSSNRLSDGS